MCLVKGRPNELFLADKQPFFRLKQKSLRAFRTRRRLSNSELNFSALPMADICSC